MRSRADMCAGPLAFATLDTPRVWSMLVSIFGDLVFREGDSIDGPVLTRLTDALEIKPEAVRVALHRLRNDGWITSVKSGRMAQHALTPQALEARNAAAPLIYTPTAQLPQGWQMAVISASDANLRLALSDHGFVAITPRVFIGHDGLDVPAGALQATGKHAPSWIARDAVPEDLTAEFDRLLTALQKVHMTIGRSRSALETALLRSLIVHHWRRLVLRYPYLPPAVTGANWPGHLCRDFVCALLEALPRPPLAALADDI